MTGVEVDTCFNLYISYIYREIYYRLNFYKLKTRTPGPLGINMVSGGGFYSVPEIHSLPSCRVSFLPLPTSSFESEERSKGPGRGDERETTIRVPSVITQPFSFFHLPLNPLLILKPNILETPSGRHLKVKLILYKGSTSHVINRCMRPF